jgi:hypothetical protein
MILYFEFEDRKVTANVTWPKDDDPIVVNLNDPIMVREFPTDLYFEVGAKNRVEFTIEDKDNERLLDLQNVISRRLQEFVNKS